MKYLTICCDGSGREYYRRITESSLDIRKYLQIQANMYIQKHLKKGSRQTNPRGFQSQEAPIQYKTKDDAVYIYNTWDEQRPVMIIKASIAPDSEPVTPICGVDMK